jgi:hypothetical protein
MIIAQDDLEVKMLTLDWNYINTSKAYIFYKNGAKVELGYIEPNDHPVTAWYGEMSQDNWTTGHIWWAIYENGTKTPISIMTGKPRGIAEVLKYRQQKQKWAA